MRTHGELQGVCSGGHGRAEDTQIFTRLSTAQALANLPGRISLIQLSVTAPRFVDPIHRELGRAFRE